VHDAAGLLRHVQSDFIEQRDGPDRKTEIGHGSVDHLDPNTLLKQVAGLVQVG
jgi:hypothetical protein